MAASVASSSPDHAGLLRKISADTAWVAAGRFADMAAVVLVNKLLAQWLAPGDFKSFLVLFNVLALLSTIGTLGLNRSIVRYLADCLNEGHPERAALVLRRSTWVTLITSIVVGVAMVAWIIVWPEESAGWMLPAALFASVVLRSLQRVSAEALRAYDHIIGASLFAGQNAGQAAGPVSDFAFLFGVAAAYFFLPGTLSTAVVINALSVAVTFPVSMWMLAHINSRTFAAGGAALVETDRSGQTSPVEDPLVPFLLTSAGMLATQILIFLTWNSDLWIADMFLKEQDAILFAPARNLLVVVMMPLALINQAVLSSIPKLHGQGQIEKLEKLLRLSSALAALPTLAAIVMMTFFGRTILTLCYNREYAAAAPLLAVLAWGRLSNAFSGVASFALTMTGNERVHLIISGVATVLYWAVAPWLAWRYGPMALAIVTATMFFLQQSALWYAVRTRVGVWCHAPTPRLRRRSAGSRLSAAAAVTE